MSEATETDLQELLINEGKKWVVGGSGGGGVLGAPTEETKGRKGNYEDGVDERPGGWEAKGKERR